MYRGKNKKKTEETAASEGKKEKARKDYFSLKGSFAVVAGADVGVGPEISRILAEAEADLALIGKDAEKIKSLSEEISAHCKADIFPVIQDVLDERGLEIAVNEVLQRSHGGYEILINNLGSGTAKNIADETREEIQHHFNENFFARLEVTKVFARRGMFGNEPGRIVHVLSQFNIKEAQVLRCGSYYMANETFHRASRELAAEWADQDVLVNNLCLGLFNQECDSEDDPYRVRILRETPMARYGKMEDLATAVLFLTSPETCFVTGVDLPVDGGYHLR